MERDHVILNLKSEYPGYTGQEKWMIITDLDEEEFSSRYPEEYRFWGDALILNTEMGDEVMRYKNNESKHRRRNRDICISAEEADELLIAEDTSPSSVENSIWLNEALDRLSKKQQARICGYYLVGNTMSTIAERENISRSAVQKSISRGLDRIRRYYLENWNDIEEETDERS